MVFKGPERAPHRSLFYALGLTSEEMKRPLVGVVSSFNEIIPGHIHLDKIAEAVKAGVRMAGGTPVEFGNIGVWIHTFAAYLLLLREVLHHLKFNSVIII